MGGGRWVGKGLLCVNIAARGGGAEGVCGEWKRGLVMGAILVKCEVLKSIHLSHPSIHVHTPRASFCWLISCTGLPDVVPCLF